MTIKFGGRVEGFEENGRTFYRTVDTQDILAVPYDIPVVGYAGETVNKLRVWAAEPVEEHFDLEAFNRGDYALADAERAEPRPSAPSSTPTTPASTAVCCA